MPLNKLQALNLIKLLNKSIKNPETSLKYRNQFTLLTSVVLSAQCTDKRVNQITPALFDRFPTAESLAEAEVGEVFEYIRSCSYPNNKAKHLVGMAQSSRPRSQAAVHGFLGKEPRQLL
mgnify:CR=1 FL=1